MPIKIIAFIATFLCPCHAQALSILNSIQNVPPVEYPILGRYSNLHGSVHASIKLNQGKISNLTFSKADAVLTKSTAALIKQIQFKPTASGELSLEITYELFDAPKNGPHWQRFSIDLDTNRFTLHATRKVSTDIDSFK